MKRIITLAAAALLCLGLTAQSRTIRTINDRWNFTKEGVTTTVNIPHTWNAEDTWDEEPGFYRDMCTYSRKLVINDDLEGKNVYIRFEGANQETDFPPKCKKSLHFFLSVLKYTLTNLTSFLFLDFELT